MHRSHLVGALTLAACSAWASMGLEATWADEPAPAPKATATEDATLLAKLLADVQTLTAKVAEMQAAEESMRRLLYEARQAMDASAARIMADIPTPASILELLAPLHGEVARLSDQVREVEKSATGASTPTSELDGMHGRVVELARLLASLVGRQAVIDDDPSPGQILSMLEALVTSTTTEMVPAEMRPEDDISIERRRMLLDQAQAEFAHRRSVFSWQRVTSVGVFLVVHGVLAIALWAAIREFIAAGKQRRKEGSVELEIGASSLALKTARTGVLLLTAAGLLYLLYVRFVYPIHELG